MRAYPKTLYLEEISPAFDRYNYTILEVLELGKEKETIYSGPKDLSTPYIRSTFSKMDGTQAFNTTSFPRVGLI